MNDPGSGTVYTETVVYSPPEAYVNDVPYQLAIVELGGRPAPDRPRSTASAPISAIACRSSNFATTSPSSEKQIHETR